MSQLEQFTGLYPLSKTLRFELIPVGKTKDNIEKSGILENDNRLAVGYKAVKKVIDEYHKSFVELMLNNFELNLEDKGNANSLAEYYYLYHLPVVDAKRKSDLPRVQESLRKQISVRFTKSEQYKRLFGKELVREDLAEFVKTPKYERIIRQQPGNESLTEGELKQIQQDVIAAISQFNDFTTYFIGFYENRKNMYVADEKATAIAYRMINENLPKFIDNMDVFERIASSGVASHFDKLYKDMEEYLNVASINEMFQLDYFSMVLTQAQIDVYNAIIGGKVLDDGTKIQGLNEYVNLYNQQQKDKSARLPKLKPLFKQILSDRNAISWLPDAFENDNEMLEAIEKCYQDLNANVFDGEHSLKMLLGNLKDYDLEHVFLPNDLQLTEIAQKMFGDWSVYKRALSEYFISKNPKKTNESGEKYEERVAKFVKSNESFSFSQLNAFAASLGKDFAKTIEDYYMLMGAEDDGATQKLNHFARIANTYSEVAELLNTPYPEDKKLSQDKANVEKIKNLLDAIKDLQRYVKPLLGKGNESDKDNRFYGEFIPLWERLDQITLLYNMVRNRMTCKPYSTEKIKLNFENKGNFLGGWVDSKTENSDNGTQYGGYLFRRKNGIGEYDYFIGVSANVRLFRNTTNVSENDKSQYERLDYYQLKSQTIYGNSYIGDYAKESRAIINAIDVFVHQNGNAKIKAHIEADRAKKTPRTSTAIGYLTFIKEKDIVCYNNLLEDDGFQDSNRKMITSLKGTLALLARVKKAQKLAEKQYELFSDIMSEIDDLVKEKVFDYFPISQTELDKALNSEEKTLFLFKITNKDLSYAEKFLEGKRLSRGTENLHTLYFKALMEGNQSVFDIGTGAIFFRKGSISYSDEVMQKGHHADELKGKFKYPIIKDKRFTADKFQLHLSIVQNYKSPKTNNINPQVNEFIKNGGVDHIIGIDRGERHLLYLSLIDLKGNIVKQMTLNEIVNEYKGNEYRTDYHKLLDDKETERDLARRSWQTIENIKELKEGYLSQVIHKICEMMIEYNAIVVLEDLNFGFMRGRQKVEKQVYQKFEKMLIDKLNYLVDKKQKSDLPGGTLNAYQLTNKFESFQKVGKQTGFLFYIPAWNTSKMDPTTGFVNLFDMRYENMEKSRALIGKFDSIRYNEKKGWFEWAFDYDNFTTKAEGTRTQWTLCTFGTRIETHRDPEKNNQFVSNEFDLTKAFKELFEKCDINLKGNLKEQICAQNDAAFFKGLLHLLHMTLQMRNSITGTETDYLISPVMNAKGEFYDSRSCVNNLPNNADANGAYNIARKGLWIIEQIKAADDLSQLKLAISNKEWLRYAQSIK